MKSTTLNIGTTIARATIVLLMVLVVASCKWISPGEKAEAKPKSKILKPVMLFQQDSAYQFISDQLDFGPRVPGTPAHDACAKYLVEKLRSYGVDSIITQKFNMKAYTGDILPLTNIMGRFDTSNPDRVLLVAHYDTRPWADREKNPDRVKEPILGANDGASGVAVILELARLIQQQRPNVGVDILFVDGEDYGNSGWAENDSTWCLGSQYWVEHMPADYATIKPRFGILLDMVGAHYARFHREYLSDLHAPQVVDKIWSIAANSGRTRFFKNVPGGSVVDDHLFINEAGIPTADIIDCNNETTGTFPDTWHTTRDDLSGISKATLRAVGQTVSNVLYYEKK